MRFRIVSDLHLEFAGIDLPVAENEHKSTLILAGDVCVMNHRTTFHKFFTEMCDRFMHVVYVPGNHEHYHGAIDTSVEKFWRLLDLDVRDQQRLVPKNLHVMNNSVMIIDDVVVIGSTMWTGFRGGNPIIMYDAMHTMNDYNNIRLASDGYRRMHPNDVLDIHRKSSDFVFNEINVAKGAGYDKVLVATHHAPTHLSIAEKYAGRLDENELYANHFEYKIEECSPSVWVHGHLHNRSDYMIGDTRVVCNPRGYVLNHIPENTGFDPLFELVL